jgi:hypothetical protein
MRHEHRSERAAPEGDRPSPNDSAATTQADETILAASAETICGRCGGPSGPEGAWCDQCINECREYTRWLDSQAAAGPR